MIALGSPVPSLELRTDEGTPISLRDLQGRALALFLLGTSFTPTAERLLDVLSQNAGQFLTQDFSPVAVMAQDVAALCAFRQRQDVPFILLSDADSRLQQAITGDESCRVGACLIDERSTVVEILPLLPPTELVRMTVERISRLRAARTAKKEKSGS